MNWPAGWMPESFHGEKLELPGLALHYVEGGSGPAVVLLHGYTDAWYSFRLILPLLAPRRRCVAIDQRGHGASTYGGDDFTLNAFAADAIELITRMRTGPVACLVTRWEALARKVALRRPDLVERLILAGSGMRTDNHMALQGLKAAIDRHPEAIPRSFVEAQLASVIEDRSLVPEWFFDGCAAAGAEAPLKTWRGALSGLASDDHSAQLSRIVQPVLIIGGEKDSMFPPQEPEALARALPRARLQLYKNTGHYPHWEHPDWFARDVIRFMGEPG